VKANLSIKTFSLWRNIIGPLLVPKEGYKCLDRVGMDDYRGIAVFVVAVLAAVEGNEGKTEQDTCAHCRRKHDFVDGGSMHSKQVAQSAEGTTVLVDNHRVSSGTDSGIVRTVVVARSHREIENVSRRLQGRDSDRWITCWTPLKFSLVVEKSSWPLKRYEQCEAAFIDRNIKETPRQRTRYARQQHSGC
jgi:hypothetical protein